MRILLGGGRRFWWLGVLLLVGSVVDRAEAQERGQPAGGANATVQQARVQFRPPSTGAPSVRLTGGSRGTGEAAMRLDVLAPDDIGLTTVEQPSLFWYQSKPAAARFELTLLQENKIQPLMQVQVERAAAAGIQRLRLSDHGVKLRPGVEYQWVVALITDPENRSTDLVASGVIQRVELTEELGAKVRSADPSERAAVYAAAGIWYDALSAVSDQIEAHPQEAAWRAVRSDLLSQVGLEAAARF
jgi:hypothetical protein